MAEFAGKFERVVFVVSSGRTGTTALAHHLGRCYENVRALHEPRPSWRLRRASTRAFSCRISLNDLRKLLADSRRQLIGRIDRPVYVESNPYLSGFLDVFDDVFERPMVLHVVRDPRSYVRSALNWGASRGLKYLFNAYVPHWTPKPEHMPGHTGPTWKDMSERRRSAWFWNITNRELNRGEEIYGDRYMRVKFEDLFARDGSGLKKLTEWIGLPWNAEMMASANSDNVNASRKNACPKWNEWTEDMQREVLEECGDLMRMYGYDGGDALSFHHGAHGEHGGNANVR